MIRARMSQKNLITYFESVLNVINKTDLAKSLNVSLRTINDWKRGKHSIPYSAMIYFHEKHGIQLPHSVKLIDTIAERRQNGKLGAIARFERHGPLATQEGRIKGGQNSAKMHLLNGCGITIPILYKTPRKSQLLAEFTGILVGDGHISNYQIYIYLNRVDDAAYVKKVSRYVKRLYFYEPRIYNHQIKKLAEIQISSKCIVDSLKNRGMKEGNKIANQQIFPQWITKSDKYSIRALRGLFDTDGSILIDRHFYKKKKYLYFNVVYTIFNKAHYNQVYNLLRSLRFHPTTSSINRIGIRKSAEVDAFFSIIQPANPKHVSRYRSLKLEE